MKLLKSMLALTLGFSCLTLPVQTLKAAELLTDEDLAETTDLSAPEAWGATPNANQYKYHKDELALFVHFGMNTFTGSEWGSGNESPSQFTLTDPLDAETLIKTAYDAGFKKVIVTAKHHDGFCIFRSDYTDHDLEATNYEGDVLAEISAAATKYNMDMGLYLSPWDVNADSYGYYDADGNALCDSSGNPKNGMTWDEVEEADVLDYNEYYNNQLIEILSDPQYGNNGRFVEVWMDGAKGSGSATQNYTFEKWFETIQKYEGIEDGAPADCMLFGAQAYTTVHWIGNENGFASSNTWSKVNVDYDANTIQSNIKSGMAEGFEYGNKWSVPEADARITQGWFWWSNRNTPKSLEQLSDMYFRSVGNGAPLLLNVPPNNQGTTDQAILDRLAEFGAEIQASFDEDFSAAEGVSASASSVYGNAKPYAASNVLDESDDTYWAADADATSGTIVVDLGEQKSFDMVTIEEPIKLGQRIKSFTVEVSKDGSSWDEVATGTTIGAKKIARFKKVNASQIRITVETTESIPLISSVGVYKATKEFEVKAPMPDGFVNVDNLDTDTTDGFGFTYSGWTQETGAQYLNGTNMYATQKELTLTFNGSKAYLIGTVDPSHGTADIYIDNVKVASINTQKSPRKVGQILFVSDDLTHGNHTLRLVGTARPIGIEGAAVISNEGKGAFEFEYDSYDVPEDSQNVVTIKRVGGSVGEASVLVASNPGSAVQGDFDADFSETVVFADGETEKQITIATKRNTKDTPEQYFTLEMSTPSEGALLGYNSVATMNIQDYDGYSKEQLQALYDEVENYDSTSYEAGWSAFATWRTYAQTALASEDAGEWGKAYVNLMNAKAALVATTGAPFNFPSKENETITLEAETATLENTGGDSETWKLGVNEATWASNGQFVNCMNSGDVIKFAYEAKVAGTYKVVVTYRSGSNTNKLVWSDTAGNITAGEVSAGNGDASVTKTAEFELEITKPGSGVWTFTVPSGNSPQTDKFDITLVKAIVDKAPLQALITSAQSLSADAYTTETFAALQTEITAAQAVYDDADATIAEVEQAIASLQAAIDALEVKAIDESTLINTEANKDAVSILDFSSECDSSLEPAGKGTAASVLDYDTTSYWHSNWQTAVGDVHWLSFDLGKAYDLTDVTFLPRQGSQYVNGDIFELKVYVSEDETFEDADVVGNYTYEYSGHMLVSRDFHRAYLGDDVNGRYVKLEVVHSGGDSGNDKFASITEVRFYGTTNAVDPEPSVDKSALEKLVHDAAEIDQTLYTEESATALLEAIISGEAVLNSETATQETVNQAIANIEEAIEGLELKPVAPTVDKAALVKAIADAKAVDTTKYTEATVTVLTTALTAAESVNADENATQEAVDAAVKALTDAINALEEKPATPQPEPKPTMDFYDVQDEKAWFYGSVEKAFQKGLMLATGKAPVDGKPWFEPDTNISRAMVATVLYRMAGQPKVEFKATFSDVTNGSLWYSTAITWAAQNGVVSGYKDGRFGPDDNITRQDLAIMLRNYAKSAGLDTNVTVDFAAFKDGKQVVDYAASAVAWCVEAKLMSGSVKADGTYLMPTANATRAECAKMFSLLDDTIKAHNAK